MRRKIRIRKLVPMGHETVMAEPHQAIAMIAEALKMRWFVFCEPMNSIIRSTDEVNQLIDELEEVVILPPVAGGTHH